jgi:hypothetical protein
MSSTMLLTVKHVIDAQQSGTGEKGALFVVDSVEMANVCRPKSDTAPLSPMSCALHFILSHNFSSLCFDLLICTCSHH